MLSVSDFYERTDDLTRRVFSTLAERKAAFPLQLASELTADFSKVDAALRSLAELGLVELQYPAKQVSAEVVTLSEDGIRLALNMQRKAS